MWRVFQDWRAWAAEGIVDLLVPMVYRAEHTTAGADSFVDWVTWSRAQTSGRHLAIGIGSYLNAVEGTLRQVRRATEPTPDTLTPGVVLFSMGAHNAPVPQNPLAVGDQRDTPYRGFDDLAAGLTTGRTTGGQLLELGTGRAVFATPAAPPAMPWKTAPTLGHLMGVRDERRPARRQRRGDARGRGRGRGSPGPHRRQRVLRTTAPRARRLPRPRHARERRPVPAAPAPSPSSPAKWRRSTSTSIRQGPPSRPASGGDGRRGHATDPRTRGKEMRRG